MRAKYICYFSLYSNRGSVAAIITNERHVVDVTASPVMEPCGDGSFTVSFLLVDGMSVADGIMLL